MVKVSRKSSTKRMLLSISLVVVLTLLLGAILEKKQIINLFGPSAKDITTQGPTPKQKAEEASANAEAKQEFLDSTYKDSGDKPVSSPPNDMSLTVNAKQESSSVTVLTEIRAVAKGTCALVITNGSKSSSQKADVIYQPEFSSCAGFSVPVSSVGSGTWNIELTVNPIGGGAISKSTTLEVRQ